MNMEILFLQISFSSLLDFTDFTYSLEYYKYHHFFNVIIGTYERRGHYEMVEKVGLYWHFVDLVWVFVFTFFYLV